MGKARDWRCACRAAAEAIAAVLLLLGATAAAAESVGEIVQVQGVMFARTASGASRVLALHSPVDRGDVLVTGRDTFARVRFVDRGEVLLRPGTQLRVSFYAYDERKPDGDSAVLDLIKGGLRAITGLIGKRSPQTVRFDTIVATLGVRGTEFGVLLCAGDCGGILDGEGNAPPDGLHTDVESGTIVLTNGAGEQLFGAGTSGYVPNATTLPALVDTSPSRRAIPPGLLAPAGDGGAATAPGVSGDQACEID